MSELNKEEFEELGRLKKKLKVTESESVLGASQRSRVGQLFCDVEYCLFRVF